jgi:hypothetical protein
MFERELTPEEIKRQDKVDNMIMELIVRCAPPDAIIDWDIELIGQVRDALWGIIVEQLNLMTSYAFYPYIPLMRD